MAIIGNFTRAKDGGWEGSIRTFTTNMKARFVPNDDRTGNLAPDFLVISAQCELGAAWVHRRQAKPSEFLSVQFDDPAFSHPVSAALFYSEGGDRAQLIWSRRSKGKQDESAQVL